MPGGGAFENWLDQGGTGIFQNTVTTPAQPPPGTVPGGASGGAPPVLGPGGDHVNPTGNIGHVDKLKYWMIPGINEAEQIFNQGLPDIGPQLGQTIDSLASPDNPFLQGLQDFQSQSNPYADELFNRGADQISNQINSQFGLSGQSGVRNSSLNLDSQIRDLSAFGGDFYGGIYDNQQNRYLDSLKTGGQQFNQQQVAAGSLLPGLLQLQQSQPWANLQNYTDIVSRLGGGYQPSQKTEDSSGFDKLLGLGSLGVGIAGLF